MPYRMDIYVDGGCRGNGYPGAIGAAAAVHAKKYGGTKAWTVNLPRHPPPTNQRAEIRAIQLALEVALKKRSGLENPAVDMDVHIFSDSKYAVNCMTTWIYKWANNGWLNQQGNQVANRDLIETASDLDDRVKDCGEVAYHWIPRSENRGADEYCNRALDRQCD